MDQSRRYTDEEVALILRTAVALSEAPPATSAGLTLAELQEIGREAGLDPQQIAAAAATLNAARTPSGGLVPRMAREELLAGAFEERAASGWVREVEEVLGRTGAVHHFPGELRWSSGKHTGNTDAVEIGAEGPRTRIRVEIDRRAPALTLALGAPALAGAAAALAGPALGVLHPGGWLLLALGGVVVGLVLAAGAALLARRWVAGRLERLLARLESYHAQLVGASAGRAGELADQSQASSDGTPGTRARRSSS